MEDNIFRVVEELQKDPDMWPQRQQPSPAADPIIVDTAPASDDVAKLLREIELRVGWLDISPVTGMVCMQNVDEDTEYLPEGKVFETLLLGAICADCDDRKWGWVSGTYGEGYKFSIIQGSYGGRIGISPNSIIHAALLAFRDALLAGAVCPECKGSSFSPYGLCTDDECLACNGTGKVREA